MPKVFFDIDRCKGCELCTSVCPKSILKIDGNLFNKKGFHPVMITNHEECIGCCFCATICPDCVIEIEK